MAGSPDHSGIVGPGEGVELPQSPRFHHNINLLKCLWHWSCRLLGTKLVPPGRPPSGSWEAQRGITVGEFQHQMALGEQVLVTKPFYHASRRWLSVV